MRNPLLLAADFLTVLVFVVVGRQTHNEGNAIGQILVTAAPFVFALLVAWGVAGAWKRPLSVPRGIAVALITTVLGSLVRRYGFGEGIANPFIFVTGGFFVGVMVSWRWMALAVTRRTPSPA